MLHRKICMWLRAKGTPFRPDQIQTGHIGKGPETILRWDEMLGRRPTVEDLASIDPDLEDMAIEARAKRARLLSESDWAMLPDVAKTLGARVTDWALYRQALRDISKQEHFPRRVQWPEKPV